MVTSFADVKANVVSAITERIFYHDVVVKRPNGQCVKILCRPDQPHKGHITEVMRAATVALRRIIWPSTPIAILDYPEQTYRGRRLKLYTTAAIRAAREVTTRACAYLSSFLKHEKLPVVDGKRTVPRVIQPRSPRYNVLVGRYLHHLEGIVYSKLATLLGGPTVMKGFNAEQVGDHFYKAWTQFSDPCAVGLDAHRFDQHVRSEMLKWEHSIYKMFYPGDKHFANLLKWQLMNRGFIRAEDTVYEYIVDGGRCSGDMNTAMGNCLIMCSALYVLLRVRQQTGIRVLNNGDDVVLIGEKSEVMRVLPLIPSFFKEIGMVIKVEPPVYTFEEIEFCQTRPIMRGNAEPIMCRNVIPAMCKDISSLRLLRGDALKSQLGAVAKCGLALSDGVPVMGAFYSALLKDSSGADATKVHERFYEDGFYRLSAGLVHRGRAITPEARVSFNKAFGIPPDLQVALESEYNMLPPLMDQVVGRIPVPLVPYERGWLHEPWSGERPH